MPDERNRELGDALKALDRVMTSMPYDESVPAPDEDFLDQLDDALDGVKDAASKLRAE